jgi:hypothetical protein
MNLHDLDELLALESTRAMPPAPDLRAAVQREIARRQNRSKWDWILPLVHWRELVAVPRVAFAGIAFAVVAAVLPTMVSAYWSDAEEVSRARGSLHLDVFSVEHGSVPMAVLHRSS